MGLFDTLSTQFGTSQDLSELTVEESTAVRDLLTAVALVDGHISHEELEALEVELGKLPFSHHEVFAEDAVSLLSSIREKTSDEAATRAFLAEIASAIEDDGHRRVALSMAAAIAYTDGARGDETDLVHRAGHAFGLDEDAVEGIITDSLLDAVTDRIG